MPWWLWRRRACGSATAGLILGVVVAVLVGVLATATGLVFAGMTRLVAPDHRPPSRASGRLGLSRQDPLRWRAAPRESHRPAPGAREMI